MVVSMCWTRDVVYISTSIYTNSRTVKLSIPYIANLRSHGKDSGFRLLFSLRPTILERQIYIIFGIFSFSLRNILLPRGPMR